MLRFLAICCAIFTLAFGEAARAQAPIDGVAQAITRGMGYANARSLEWKSEKVCASCHHAPMALWVINAARKRGVAVDESIASTLHSWIQSEDNTAAFFPTSEDTVEQRAAPLGAAYALIALATGPADEVDAAFVRRAAEYFAEVQKSNGSWVLASTKGRPPILAGPSVTTRLVRLALGLFPWAANGDPGEADLAKADDWLAQHPPVAQQEYALDLMLAVRLGMSDAVISQRAERLLMLQHDDGGWSQTPDMASDAYATGQALAALGIAARNASADERVARGIRFLLAAQQADGSWPMLSRPSQGEEGDPGEGNEPINMAGTTWALLGLVRAGL